LKVIRPTLPPRKSFFNPFPLKDYLLKEEEKNFLVKKKTLKGDSGIGT